MKLTLMYDAIKRMQIERRIALFLFVLFFLFLFCAGILTRERNVSASMLTAHIALIAK